MGTAGRCRPPLDDERFSIERGFLDGKAASRGRATRVARRAVGATGVARQVSHGDRRPDPDGDGK
jgi:hypothetical protein